MSQFDSNHAIDLPVDRRPGVPAERAPQPVGSAHWSRPERQAAPHDMTFDAQRTELTATFGTGQPPRGASGMMRRAAYAMPDYAPKRWALLLFADRVDAWEDRALRLAKSPWAWLAATAVIGVFAGARAIALPRARS